MSYVRTNIYLTTVQKTKLTKLAAETGIAVAELIRRILDGHLDKSK